MGYRDKKDLIVQHSIFFLIIVESRNKFLSKKKEELRISQEYMKKLNLKEIRWILKELKRGKISVYQIAKLQKVSPRWVRQLPKKYAGIYPYKIRILKCGRKPKEIPEEERKLILDVKKDNPVGPVKLEILLKKRGIRMPHNKIYKILKEAGLIKEQKNKQKQKEQTETKKIYKI